MNLTVKKNGGMPSLFSNLWGASLFDRDLFDLDNDFLPSRLGVNVPTVNITETTKEYQLELAAPGLDRKDFDIKIDNHTLTISAEKEEEKKEKKESIPAKNIHSIPSAGHSHCRKMLKNLTLTLSMKMEF